jgi:hypothetical protein
LYVSGLVVGADLQWGTVGEWVSGTATLLAVIVAIVVPLVLWTKDRSRRDAEDRQRIADDDRRRSHSVNVWREQRQVPNEHRAFGQPATVPQTLIVLVNVGPDVIHRWHVELGVMKSLTQRLSDAERFEWHSVMTSELDGALPPGGRIERVLVKDNVSAMGVPAVNFTDSHGKRWRRQGDDVAPGEAIAQLRVASAAAAGQSLIATGDA